MALLPNGQSCLENLSIIHRKTLLQKNDYNKVDEYNVTHPNAIADGDGRGRGTLHGGHGHSTPDCSKASYICDVVTSPIDYSTIDTFIGEKCEGGAGDCIDWEQRKTLTRINNYSPCGVVYSTALVRSRMSRNSGPFIAEYIRSIEHFNCDVVDVNPSFSRTTQQFVPPTYHS